MGAYPKTWITNTTDSGLFDGQPAVPGIGTKALRPIAIAATKDTVLVPGAVMPLAQVALQQRRLIGRSPQVYIQPVPDLLSPRGHREWFYLGHQARVDPRVRARQIFATVQLTSKNAFIQLARKQGWPIPDTVCVSAGQPERIGDPSMYRVLKADRSAGGFGVTVANDGGQWADGYDTLLATGCDFQMQEYLDPARFFGVQYCHGESVITEQLVKQQHYIGARVLLDTRLERRIWQTVIRPLHYVADAGVPVFSLDVAVLPNGRIVLLECNPRYGATTYPWLLAEQLGLRGDQWEYRYVQLPREEFSLEDCRPLLYAANTGHGMIVVDWGVPDRELGVLFVGPLSVREGLQAQLREQL